MFVTFPGAAFAGGQGQDNGDRIQDQDGSCLLPYSTDLSGSFTLAGDQDRDRLQDGSCGDYSTDSVNMILADGRQRDKDNDKDKLKDCKVTS